MLKKGTKLYSIFKGKCPYCHQGKFFVSKAYNLKHCGQNYEKCSSCNQSFSKEPGFYYGAMYVSYGLGIAVFVAIFILMKLLMNDPSAMTYFLLPFSILILLAPYMYALSKIIWANMFMHYKKQKNNINKTIKTKQT